jgi:hypothetical protein
MSWHTVCNKINRSSRFKKESSQNGRLKILLKIFIENFFQKQLKKAFFEEKNFFLIYFKKKSNKILRLLFTNSGLVK